MIRKPVLIVDGYNVVCSEVGPYANLAERDLDAARTRLVADVAAYAHGEMDAVVVFDGGRNRHSDGAPHDVGGVTVVFSPFGVDADSVIEQQVAQHRHAGDRVTVVTSDAQTQWTVMGPGIDRLSASGFTAEIARERGELDDANPSGSKRSTLDARVDPAVTDRLARWARGER